MSLGFTSDITGQQKHERVWTDGARKLDTYGLGLLEPCPFDSILSWMRTADTKASGPHFGLLCETSSGPLLVCRPHLPER